MIAKNIKNRIGNVFNSISNLFDKYLEEVILKFLIYSKTIDENNAKIGRAFFTNAMLQSNDI